MSRTIMERLLNQVKVGSILMRSIVYHDYNTPTGNQRVVFAMAYWEVLSFDVQKTRSGPVRVTAYCKCLYDTFRARKIGRRDYWSLDPSVDWKVVKF